MSKILKICTPNRLLRIFVVFNLIFAILFRFADVNIKDSLLILLVVNVQISLGGLIWTMMRSQSSIDLVEFVGMGGAFGFGLSLISSQLFRTFVPFSISWLILPVLSLFVLQIRSGSSLRVSFAKLQAPNDLWLVFSGTLIALSTSWYWLVSTAIAVFLWTVLHYLRESNRSAGVSQSKWHTLLALSAVAMSVRAVLHLSSLTEIRNPLWWNLRYGTMQDPDSIFFESMVQSTKNFGGGANIFFKDLKFYYHWFSFAWESTLGALSAPEPFVVSAIMGPAIVLFVVLCLVFRIAKRVSSSSFSGPVALYVVAMMCAGPVPFLRVLHPYSFSFNFALIFVYGIVVVISFHQDFKTKSFIAVIFFLSICLIGSKVTFVPVLLVGFFCCAILGLSQKPRLYRFWFSFVTTLCAVVISFFTIYSFGQRSGSNYRISFADILWQKGNLEESLALSVVLISFCVTSVLIMSPTFGLFFLSDVMRTNNKMLLVFSTTAGLSGVLLGFILSDPSESNAYFIQGGLALLVPVSAAVSIDNFGAVGFKARLFVVLTICVCFEMARWWPRWYRNVTGEGLQPFYKTSLILGIPFLVSFFGYLLAKSLPIFRSRIDLKRLLSVLLIASSAGSYYANAGDFSAKGQWAAQNVRFKPFDTISGSQSYRDLLLWLRDNSRKTDLVATNRYCSLSTESPPDCLAMWSLTSAITGRQMLSEGTWTTNIISGVKDETEKRRSLVENFVNLPTKETRALLVDYGVRWVVADYAVTQTRNWNDFATVRFENRAGAILDLDQLG